MKKILVINSGSNFKTSTSIQYVEKIAKKIKSKLSDYVIIERDTTYSNLPLIDEDMLHALLSKGERTVAQKEALCFSDMLIDELIEADYIVIGLPIYNFSVPASLKVYFDLIARAGRIFKYTEDGAVGLLKNKKAFIVITSGGTPIGSTIDFASPYSTYFLSFLGISDVEIIHLDQLNFHSEKVFKRAEDKIKAIEI